MQISENLIHRDWRCVEIVPYASARLGGEDET